MTLTEVKKSVESLAREDRLDLMSFLAHLEDLESKDFLDTITRRIDEKDRHIRWDDAQTQMGEED